MLKKDLYKYISAFVMGDGGVYFSGKHCRFVKNQLEKNRDFIEWQANILRNLTEVTVREVNDFRDNRQQTLNITTRTHPIYTKVRERVYIDGYKSIDPHYLTLLDWEVLAILFMDDGSMDIDKRCDATPTFRLNTKRLSYGDSWLLKKAIKEKLDLEFNVHRHYNRYYLNLRTKDSAKFVDNIQAHIFPSFKYKLP